MLLHTLTNSFLNWYFAIFTSAIVLYGYYRKVNITDSFFGGAKEGGLIILKIFPYFTAMLIALGMLRASGAFEMLAHALSPVLSKVGMPTELLPLAIARPFSGQASNGILAELVNTHGGNSNLSHMAATLMGSTETTFYVLAIYFGSVKIRRVRHAVVVGLSTDIFALIAALFFSHLLFNY